MTRNVEYLIRALRAMDLGAESAYKMNAWWADLDNIFSSVNKNP